MPLVMGTAAAQREAKSEQTSLLMSVIAVMLLTMDCSGTKRTHRHRESLPMEKHDNFGDFHDDIPYSIVHCDSLVK